MVQPLLLEVLHIGKSFPGVRALDRVSMSLGSGEVLAVIGENGAGKSTLMKILAGIEQPDEGEIRIEQLPVEIASVRAATALGIALIHQELNLADNLDVASNIFLGREPHSYGLIAGKRIHHESKRFLEIVGLDVFPNTLVARLAIGQQQMVEIARALSADARILIMDEPTSSLSQRETDRLFDLMRTLRKRGVAIIYISHRLGEVRKIADRVEVLRDGKNVGALAQDEINYDRMVNLMVGRDIVDVFTRHSATPGRKLLAIRNLRSPAYPSEPINFELHAGEIVSLAGLVGAGRTELLRTIFGIDLAHGGEIVVDQKVVDIRSPHDAIEAGLALVPEDRKEQGLILEMAMRENVSLPGLWDHRRVGAFVNREWERSETVDAIKKLGIRSQGESQLVQYLSGGNQQKVVLAKWLALKPRVLLLDEPTRGIDVGAKEEIYRLMETLAADGNAILFVSSEMEEVLRMSDRALVMHDGFLAGELARDQLTEEAVMHLATGGKTDAIRYPSCNDGV